MLRSSHRSLRNGVRTTGRRIELEEGSLRGTIRDPSAPTNDFMELFEGNYRPGTDSDRAPTSVIAPLLMRVSQERL